MEGSALPEATSDCGGVGSCSASQANASPMCMSAKQSRKNAFQAALSRTCEEGTTPTAILCTQPTERCAERCPEKQQAQDMASQPDRVPGRQAEQAVSQSHWASGPVLTEHNPEPLPSVKQILWATANPHSHLHHALAACSYHQQVTTGCVVLASCSSRSRPALL